MAGGGTRHATPSFSLCIDALPSLSPPTQAQLPTCRPPCQKRDRAFFSAFHSGHTYPNKISVCAGPGPALALAQSVGCAGALRQYSLARRRAPAAGRTRRGCLLIGEGLLATWPMPIHVHGHGRHTSTPSCRAATQRTKEDVGRERSRVGGDAEVMSAGLFSAPPGPPPPSPARVHPWRRRLLSRQGKVKPPSAGRAALPPPPKPTASPGHTDTMGYGHGT